MTFPVVTCYILFLTLLVSFLNWTGLISLKCSAPSFVIYRLEIFNLLLSPFLFSFSIPSTLLAICNLFTLSIFEKSLTSVIGGSKKFTYLFISLVLGVCFLRQIIGFIFSRSTGWSLPVLFFSESLHECNQGLSPFLFALLVFQSFSIDNKSLFHINKRLTKIKLRKFTFQLFMCMMCMLNYAHQSILWWSLTGLLSGLIGAIALRVTQSKSKLKRYSICEQLLPNHSAIIGKNNSATSPLQQVNVGLKKYSIILIACFFLLFCNYFYTRPNFVGEATLNKIFPDDRFLLSFLLMTAPRRGDPDYLLRTIDSYLNNFPDKPDVSSLYRRTQMIIYTHFSNHTMFDKARSIYANDLKAKNYLRFYREKGSEINQRLHMSKAIKLVAENFKSTYIALVEDDFPLCDGKWKEVLTVIFNANLRVPKHCGIFVGTGGSGLFIRKNKALVASNLLLKEESLEIPPDIILQNCLMGSGKGCEECTQTLVTSKVLLMYHIGYNTSTSPDRTYLKKDFQCGWRHPFNGDPSVVTL